MISVEDSKKSKIPIPANITAILRGLWSVGTIKAAVNLNIFDAMADGARSAEEIAKRSSLDARACAIIARALVGLDLLTFDSSENKFALTEEALTYLVSDQPLYIGDYIKVHSQIQKHWENLEAVARTGEPLTEVNKDRDAQSFFPELAASLFAMNYAYASQVADQFKAGLVADKPFQVLDLACGSGVWSMPLAKESERVRVDALDFPMVIDVTKRFAEENNVSSQYSYLSGNWREIDLEKGKYDLVLLGHILHSEGMEDSKSLLDKVTASLKPGGHLVLAEFVVDETATKPSSASMFAINMFILTTKGCVFSEAQLRQMLTNCGYINLGRIGDTPYESLVLMGQLNPG